MGGINCLIHINQYEGSTILNISSNVLKNLTTLKICGALGPAAKHKF